MDILPFARWVDVFLGIFFAIGRVVVPAIGRCMVSGRESDAVGAEVGEEWLRERDEAGFGG